MAHSRVSCRTRLMLSVSRDKLLCSASASIRLNVIELRENHVRASKTNLRKTTTTFLLMEANEHILPALPTCSQQLHERKLVAEK